jgi:hypothetical protein
MGVLEVLFEVPAFIEHGLSSGALERVGGVIRDVASKQVVVWLRDGNLVETALQTANPLSGVMQAAQLASSVYDKYMTRQMISSVGSQITANHAATMTALNSLGASVQMVTAISSLTLGGQLLNLALSGATLVTINRRLGEMKQQLEGMEAKLLAEFEQDRVVDFEGAISAANDFFEGKKEETRGAAYRSAVEGLEKARKHFMLNFEKALEKAPSRNHLVLAQNYLIRAMYAETLRIRCYWAMEEDEIARKRFREAMPIFQLGVERLIRVWLGKKSGVYFHKDVPNYNLARFLRIQQWLRGVSVGDNPLVMFEILDEMRSQFWDADVLEKNIVDKVARREGISTDTNLRLANNLFQAELLIENFERLLGFELEMREARLSFHEWENLVSEEDLTEHGAALIIDSDILQRLQIQQ